MLDKLLIPVILLIVLCLRWLEDHPRCLVNRSIEWLVNKLGMVHEYDGDVDE